MDVVHFCRTCFLVKGTRPGTLILHAVRPNCSTNGRFCAGHTEPTGQLCGGAQKPVSTILDAQQVCRKFFEWSISLCRIGVYGSPKMGRTVEQALTNVG